MRVLVTRAAEDAEGTALALRAAGHEPIIAPLRVMEPVANAPVPAGPFNGILATSRHAFSGPPLPENLRALPCYCVGQASARRGVEAGYPLAEALGPTVESMAEALVRQSPGARWLYLAGTPRKPALEQQLSAAGSSVVVVERYRMRRVPALPDVARDALSRGALEAVLHYSAQSAAAFWDLARAAGLQAQALSSLHLCLSGDVAAACPTEARCHVAEHPAEAGLIQLLT